MMFSKTHLNGLPLLVWAMLLLAIVLGGAPTAKAQFFDDDSATDPLFVEDEDEYFESTGEEGYGPGGGSGGGYGAPSGGGETDYSDGNTYVDETLVPQTEEAKKLLGERSKQINITNEKETLPLNVGWGAGTGLLIGGWFALIQEGDNRTTQRSIGVGIVLGIITGVVVGTRTVFSPEAPRPGRAEVAPPSGPSFTPLVSLDSGHNKVGFQLRF